MRAVSHGFISVHHKARDANLLLVNSKTVSTSEERINSQINAELFRIHLDLCKHDLTCLLVVMYSSRSACVGADCYSLENTIKMITFMSCYM